MPLELIADRPGHALLREYEEPPLEPGEVRVRARFSSVKHGTELRAFRADTPDASDRFDSELRLHRRGEAAPLRFPMSLGNMCVGTVEETGPDASSFEPGDRVFGHLPIRETHTVPEARLHPAPEGMSPQALVYWDPADFAVGAVRDAPVRLGDRVAVTGLGAIGQMVAQLARVCGARWVAVSDPIAMRREGAARHGADAVYEPAETDVGVAVKEATGKVGADVVFETSGSYAALEDALRAVKYAGTVVSTAYYHGSKGLSLAGEWHRNRIEIVSSRAVSTPHLHHGWDLPRVRSESLALLREGRLKADGLVAPVVPFARAAEAYHEICEHPERSIKLGVDHTL